MTQIFHEKTFLDLAEEWGFADKFHIQMYENITDVMDRFLPLLADAMCRKIARDHLQPLVEHCFAKMLQEDYKAKTGAYAKHCDKCGWYFGSPKGYEDHIPGCGKP